MRAAITDKQGMTPKEWAAYWLVQHDMGDLRQDEQEEFSAWIADPINQAAMQKVQRAWALFEHCHRSPHVQAIRRTTLALKPEPKGRSSLRRTLAASAVAVTAALMLILDANYNDKTALNSLLNALPGARDLQHEVGYSTAVGERLSFTLEDGTEVTLNTNTTVAVLYSEVSRRVFLGHGQAFFDVAAQAERPFVVETVESRITALGTAFEVHVAAERLEVTLVEGEVLVERVNESPTMASPFPEQIRPPDQRFSIGEGSLERETVLRPRQRLVVSAESPPAQVSEVDVERALRWRTGFVEFDNERLEAAVAEMNRYTAHPITIRDRRAAGLRISGVFRTGQSESFLSVVSDVLPVSVDRGPDGAAQIGWRPTEEEGAGDSAPTGEI